jgi:putative hydrolase of the HAD superfamily
LPVWGASDLLGSSSMENRLLPGIQAVVFDAVGTVIHPQPPAPIVYAEAGLRFGSRRNANEILPRFIAAFGREEAIDHANGLRTSEVREMDRWRHIVAEVLDDIPDQDGCFRELFEHFSRPDAWRCDADAAATMESLARRGYALGMASNYDRRLRSVVAGLPALAPLQCLIISSEVGWRKPARQFFLALSQALNLPAQSILYVGDDLANDYEGARATGLRSVLFDPKGKHHSGGWVSIKKLSELAN